MHIKENLTNLKCHLSWGVHQGNLSKLTLSEKDQPSLVDPRLQNATAFGHKIYHVRRSIVNTMCCEIWQCCWDIFLCWAWQISFAFHLVHFCIPVPSIMTHQDNLLKTCSSQELGWVGGKPVHMQIFWVCSCIMLESYSVTFSFSRWYFKKSNTLNGSLGSWRIDTIRDTHIKLFYFFPPFSHCTEKKQRGRHGGISSLFLNPSLGSIVRVAVLVIKVSVRCTYCGTPNPHPTVGPYRVLPLYMMFSESPRYLLFSKLC